MTTTITCPFCNALLPNGGEINRSTCVRCGEAIASEQGRGAPSSISFAKANAARAEPKAAWPAWQKLAGILGLIVIAGGILLWQTRFKSRPTGTIVEAPRTVVAPVDLPGLGYLPASSDVVFAVQVPLLMEKLGAEAESDPAKALGRLGLPEFLVETVEKSSGVGLKNVDQLVVGIGLQKASLPPQIVVVVITRQPFDLADILRRTKAATLKREGRTLHVAKATTGANIALNVHWWSPNSRVLVGSLQARDFDDIPGEPRIGVSHLRAEIGSLIRDRVPSDSSAWLVGWSDKWDQHISPYIFLGVPPFQGRRDLLAPAERLRSLLVAIPQPADKAVSVQMDLKSQSTADEFRATLAERFTNEPITVSGDGSTCQIETAFDIARINSILARLLQEKR